MVGVPQRQYFYGNLSDKITEVADGYSMKYVIKITQQLKQADGSTKLGESGYYHSKARWQTVTKDEAEVLTHKQARAIAGRLKVLSYVTNIEPE
jgi:hypothetical protein